jgi:hypothetical protein
LLCPVFGERYTYAVEDARRNLANKFLEYLPELEAILANITILPTDTGHSCPISLPEKDRPIFLSALQGKATHLLTGEVRDFGSFMNKPELTSDIRIMTVAEFLKGI